MPLDMATALSDGSAPPRPPPPGEAVHDLQRCLGGWWVSNGFHMNAWNQFLPWRTMLCDKIINVIHFTSQWVLLLWLTGACAGAIYQNRQGAFSTEVIKEGQSLR